VIFYTCKLFINKSCFIYFIKLKLMADKKINGYVIHTKSILGKGSYGCVFVILLRSTSATKTTPNLNAQ